MLPSTRSGPTIIHKGIEAMLKVLLLSLLAAGLNVALAVNAAPSETNELRRAAVMDFELIDDMKAYETETVKAAQQQRLALIGEEIRRQFSERGMYQIVEHGAAAQLIADEKARQDLRDCNGCELDIGRALGAEVIVIGWVQKVSNLILNINIEVKDVGSGRMLYVKSVDLRGNTDDSWRRGIRHMVNSIEEKKQHLR